MEHIKTAYDLGINAFDTADVYANGRSEIILGKAIKKYNLPRDEIVVMTKCFQPVPHDPNFEGWLIAGPGQLDKMRYTNQYGTSRKVSCLLGRCTLTYPSLHPQKHIFDAIKKSLERLQLAYVDVYQRTYRPSCTSFKRPLKPVIVKSIVLTRTLQSKRLCKLSMMLSKLDTLDTLGCPRATPGNVGCSSLISTRVLTALDPVHKMQAYAREHGLTQFISMQNFHNAIYREEEREMAPLLQDLGVGMIPWSPLARGFLTRPIEAETTRASSDMSVLRMTFCRLSF